MSSWFSSKNNKRLFWQVFDDCLIKITSLKNYLEYKMRLNESLFQKEGASHDGSALRPETAMVLFGTI